MINPPRHSPECDRCINHAKPPFLVCTTHPSGVESDHCPDFEPAPNLSREGWQPENASYYGNELIITPDQRWTRKQQEALLDYHPMFTGRCPNCEHSLLQTYPPRVHWDCDCGWADHSV